MLNQGLHLPRNFKYEDMKVLSAFITLLFAEMSISAQTTTETDSIDTTAFDKYLDEIVIVAKKPGSVTKTDRKTYSVNQDIASTVSSAGEILNHIPSVEVDIDGNVSMRGSSNVTILINGKPSAMMAGKTRADALGQLSAANIERIEVIDNPGAEYRAEGGGGIINIIMKADTKGGFNGSVLANAGSAGRYNAGVNLNYGTSNLNFYGGYTFRRDRYDRTVDDYRISPQDTIAQTTYGLGRPVSHTFRLGMTANITPADMLSVSGNYNRRNFKRDEYVDSRTKATDGIVTDSYHRDRDADAKENMWEGAMQYSHRYGDGNEVAIGYVYSSESEDELNRYTTMRQGIETRNNETVWDANYIHNASLKWQHAVTDNIKLTAGYEFEHLKAEQNYHVSDRDGTSFIPNATESNDFTHLRMLNSIYANSDMTVGSWHINAGLRGEYTDIDNQLKSTFDSRRRHYFDLFPSARVSRHIGGSMELSTGYSMRINRPQGSDMNPFAERINPLSLEAGNPDLKPEKINTVDMGIRRISDAGSLTVNLFYRHISDGITEVSRYIDNGVLLTTKENLRTSDNAGVELVWNMHVAGWLDINLNGTGYYNRINASGLGFGGKREMFSWSGLLNADFTPIKHGTVQLNARYHSATLVPQGKRDGDFQLNMGMKYDIPSINLALFASVTDLLDTYKLSYTLDTPALKQKVEKRRNPRIIYVGLSWNFGGGSRHQHHNVEYDEEM